MISILYHLIFDKIFREYSNKGVTKELIEMIGKITGNDELQQWQKGKMEVMICYVRL